MFIYIKAYKKDVTKKNSDQSKNKANKKRQVEYLAFKKKFDAIILLQQQPLLLRVSFASSCLQYQLSK